jgi:metal-responsive CopG/Arc/MetJ family transcriptional regulator
MKVKTSITLERGLLKSLDRLAGPSGNRSALIARAVQDWIAKQARLERDRRDLQIINRHAGRLNREAADVLDYQVEV